jgi:hypothetical protein
LIAESIGEDKIINFTEKTLYPMLGLTFPIWIGGYKQAKLWQQHGFDTFNDVINHDYQHCDNIVERCYLAFEKNLPILTDLDYAKKVKQQHIKRLEQNKINAGINIHQIYKNSLSKLPSDLLEKYHSLSYYDFGVK